MKLKNHVTTQPIEENLLILDLEGNVYFSLNETGRFMLESLLKGWSMEQTAQEAEKIFYASYERLLSDLKAFVETLQQENLIEMDDADSFYE